METLRLCCVDPSRVPKDVVQAHLELARRRQAYTEMDAEFVLVLLEHGVDSPPGPTTLQHLGFAVASREEVDRAAAAARAEGVLVLEPVYAGPIVGYFCLIEDPDGNHVEFSYGQPINPRQLHAATTR